MRRLDRRQFLNESALLAAAAASLGAAGATRADELKPVQLPKVGADEKLRVAVIGVNGRGMSHVDAFANKNGCIITTICDADEGVIGRAMKAVDKAQGKEPTYVQDLRKVVEDPKIDIVTIATPNHWHSLAAIWAMQNGKDVYVEKPVSHNVFEGHQLAETARKTKRICQSGTQSRSGVGLREAMKFLHDGKLGKVKLARGLCYKLRPSIKKVGAEGGKIPEKCDYDLWCGPAPVQKPLMRTKLHYDWHWIWDYGNGDLGNQGVHEMDKARWGLNKELPKSVFSLGGRFYPEPEDGQTANTQICVFDYGDCELIFEVRGWPSKTPYPGSKSPKDGTRPQNFVGNIYYGSEGFMVVPDYSHAVAYTKDGEIIKEFSGGENHFANFIKAVRSRKPEDLNCEVREGHLSSALCHLANISYRLGSAQPFDKETKAIGDNKEVAATFERTCDHLKDNGFKLSGMNYVLGPKLDFDGKEEKFTGSKEANAMLSRDYRKGFEVPSKL
jgi:predicted dehydrogenase